MGYTYQTFAQLKTALSLNLSDSTNTFWTDAELGILLNAAFREWNSIARMFRDRGTFPTTNTDTFYDLRTLLQNGTGEFFLAPVITDADLLVQLKYMLMEPVVGFTDGFALDDINNSFAQRRDQFMLETGMIIAQPASQLVPSGDGRVQFTDDSIIDVRRATWTDLDGNITTLFREDEYTASMFNPSWPQSSGTPQRFSIYPDPLLTLQLIPPPVDNGTLTLQTISSGQVLDDFTPTILWGVLADVLASPGPGNDPMRASYCEQRFKEGIIVGKQVVTVMKAYINGVPVSMQAVYDLDTFQPSWTTRGVPNSVAMLGSNLVVVSPAADDVYAVVMDCVRNAPQLVNNTDKVPIGREYLDTFIDYATHLATFKQGGAEFQSTLPQYDAFVKAAIAYNNRMNAQNLNYDTLVDLAEQQEGQQSLRTEAVV